MDYLSTSDANARFYQRSVTCELELGTGEYVVYVSFNLYQNQRPCLFFSSTLLFFFFGSLEWIVTNIIPR